jgi:hypothetical protein
MMNCTGFYEDARSDIGGEESVNNKPVVIAPWSLSELVLSRSGSDTIADTTRGTRRDPGNV